MARARRTRRTARWSPALVVAAAGLLGLAGTGSGSHAPILRTVDAVAVSAAPATGAALPEVAAIPPAVADRVLDAVTDRPSPRASGPDALVLVGAAAVAAALAAATATGGRRRRPLGVPLGSGSTRAPPVTR